MMRPSPTGGPVDPADSGDPVELARAMIRIPSVNPGLEEGGAGEGALARQIAEWLSGWGLRTRIEPVTDGSGVERCNVRATLPGDPGAPTLLLNGHLDTVGVVGMSIDPFDPVVRGGRLRGRGACDMKAGNAVLLATAHRLASAPPRGTLELLFTADEEHASIGMRAAVERGISADFAVIAEPTSLAVMPAHKGFAWVRADFTGRAAHGSRPEVGIDAIRSAGRLLAGLDTLEEALRDRPPHPLLGHGSLHAGTVHGGTAPSVYPERCSLLLERRTLPEEDPGCFEGELRELLEALTLHHPELSATLSTELLRPGSEVSTDHPALQLLLRMVKEAGLPAKPRGMTAWVDAAFLNEVGIPTLCFGPGSIREAHSAAEWVPIREIELGAEVLTRFARRQLGDV